MSVSRLYWGLASLLAAVTTGQNGPDMNVRATSTDEIELTWQHPDCTTITKPYRLEYLNKQTNTTADVKVDHRLTKYKVTDLDTSTVYHLRLFWECTNGKNGQTDLKKVKTLSTDDTPTQEWYDGPMFYFGLGAGGTLILVVAITSISCIVSSKCKRNSYAVQYTDADADSLKMKSLYATPTTKTFPADTTLQTKRHQLATDGTKDAKGNITKAGQGDVKKSGLYDSATTVNQRPDSDMYLHPKTVEEGRSSVNNDDMYTDFDSVSVSAADGNDKQLCPYVEPVITNVTNSNATLPEKLTWRQGRAINETTVQISLSFKTGSGDNVAVSTYEEQ